MTGRGESPADRAALIPSIEAVLFSEPTMNRAALDPRLRKTVRTLLNEWASLPLPAVDVEDAEILWQRLLAKHGPCTCGSGDYDPCLDFGGRGSCRLCVSLPGGWPCPAWSGSGYGMSFRDFVRDIVGEHLSDTEADQILWELTPFPLAQGRDDLRRYLVEVRDGTRTFDTVYAEMDAAIAAAHPEEDTADA